MTQYHWQIYHYTLSYYSKTIIPYIKFAVKCALYGNITVLCIADIIWWFAALSMSSQFFFLVDISRKLSKIYPSVTIFYPCLYLVCYWYKNQNKFQIIAVVNLKNITIAYLHILMRCLHIFHWLHLWEL